MRRRFETDLGFAVVDDDRGGRTGLPEVVFGQGKTSEQIIALFQHLNQAAPALATRVPPEVAAEVRAALPNAVYEPIPRLLWVGDGFSVRHAGVVHVVCAGTSDLPAAEEAARCAEWMGCEVKRTWDVGVAGLHRLLLRIDDLRQARVLIVVAGMEGALPSVVGGLVRVPVIAVPTSVGYGTHMEGVTALLAMLNSCAAGITVVNVDNGYGAAHAAWRIVAGDAP